MIARSLVWFTVTLPVSGLPTISSITPAAGTRGTTVTITINGSNFLSGAGHCLLFDVL